MKTIVKNKKVFIIIFITLIVASVLSINDYAKAQEKNINIEVLIDGIDDVPKTGRIGEPIELKENIEIFGDYLVRVINNFLDSKK